MNPESVKRVNIEVNADVNACFVFQEVNELLQKVSGTDKPVPIWSESTGGQLPPSHADRLLYSFHFRLKVCVYTGI